MIRTGIDIVNIPRMKRLVKNEGALQKMFHESELQRSEEHLAGIIAAKEAFFKALGTVPQWLDVEIVYAQSGRPSLKYSSTLKQKIKEADVSISHDQEYAVASVVLMLNEKSNKK